MPYTELSDEDKIKLAIEFVAQGQPLPPYLSSFLKEQELYDSIVCPRIVENEQITTG